MARPPDQPHSQSHGQPQRQPGRPAPQEPGRPAERRRRHLERSWHRDCDIDPMILRARQLRRQGSLPQAVSVEQELLPLF